jgi:hypothetical protein
MSNINFASLGIERAFFKSFPIAEMRLPGDIAARRKLPRVIALGESFAASGGQPAQPPVVAWRTNRLVIGSDRIAACLNLGLRAVDVLVVKGSPAALEALTHVENVYRRHDSAERDASLADLVRIVAEHGGDFPEVDEEDNYGDGDGESDAYAGCPAPTKIEKSENGIVTRTYAMEDLPTDGGDEETAPTPSPKPGRHSGGAKKNAIKKVAKLTGKTPSAVESAVHRAKKKPEAEAEEESEETECIDCHGLAVPKEVISDAYSEHVFLSHLDDKLKRMQADCTRHLIDYPTVKAALHASAVAVRQLMPESVCLYCKVIQKVQNQCKACSGRGWLRAHEMHSLPGQLKDDGVHAVVMFNGKIKFVTDLGKCS